MDEIICERENKIRKRWLFITVFLICFPTIPLLVALLLLDLARLLVFEDILAVGVFFVGQFINVWIAWYFIYRKHGTILLMFWLITTPLAILGPIIYLLKLPYTVWSIALLLFVLSLSTWWYGLSLKMYKINRRWKKMRKLQKQASCG